MKYIAAPRPELYDLEADPNEDTNLYAERSELADRMDTRLRELESDWADSPLPQQVPRRSIPIPAIDSPRWATWGVS